jgi:UDP-N-acetyl-D-mannosaminuronate dehydrogenase
MNIELTEQIEKTEEQISLEIEQIYKMFPDAKFDIAIDIEYLDEVITEQNVIIIKVDHSCYCYSHCKKNTEFFVIQSTGNDTMTNRFILNELIKQDLDLDCNHRFIEGFLQTPNTLCQFEACTGS